MCEALERLDARCFIAHNLPEAQKQLDKRKVDVIVTDLRMDGERDGMQLIRQARHLTPPPPVILVTAVNDVPTSRAALSEGAYDYITKPLDLDEFRAQVSRAAEKSQLQRENQVLAEQVMETGAFEGIIGKSEAMRRVTTVARQVAASDIPVLILGESGTGKELIARAIHNNSRRRKERLVALNCAGIAETILEDELFGHVKGAYTGAQSDREGRFEHADGGTLFLDEIGDMPATMQAKLLRVLENGEVVRLGANEPRQVDVRLVSATNRDLDTMVADKVFREDLYFRIKGVTIRIPPLRERREDIPLLVYHFLAQSVEKYGKTIDTVTPEAQRLLMSYAWPGNVRQLKTTVDEILVMTSGDIIDADQLPHEISGRAGNAASDTGNLGSLAGMSQQEVEREHIKATLKLTEGNREQAAKILGIGERTLYRKIKEFEL